MDHEPAAHSDAHRYFDRDRGHGFAHEIEDRDAVHYRPFEEEDAIDRIGERLVPMENIDQKFHLIVFSAEWCGDCVAYVPGLAKSLAMAKNDMIQAKVVDFDNHRDMADEMNIRKIPTIIVYDKNWKELGRFIESPRKFGTVEEELCAILNSVSTP